MIAARLVITATVLSLASASMPAWGGGGTEDPCGEWSQVPAPPPPNDGFGTWLNAVDAISPDDVWAVGYFRKVVVEPYTTEEYTYTLHWNGEQWQHVPSPSPGLPYAGGTECYLNGVKAFAPDDVWAVGHFKTQQSHGHVGPQPLVLHWDGDDWTQVPAPFSQGESSGAILNDIDGVAPDDFWAAGIWPSPTGYGFPVLMLHWNGSHWTIHETPIVDYKQQIRAIKAFASDDVWVVGGYGLSFARSYVIHWDGESWEQVDAPSPYFWNFLNDIDGASPDDIWIAGHRWENDGLSYQPFMLHWDGASWSEMASPGGGQSIVAIDSNNVWSADNWTVGSSIAQFDGQAWTVRATVAGPVQSTLLGMARVPGGSGCEAWAVGREVDSEAGYLPLIERLQPPQQHQQPADITGDGSVNTDDLLLVINAWGACATDNCPADIAPMEKADGVVDINDLLMVISNWS